MPPLIDPLNPVQGNPTTASVRENFAHAKDEIEALQVGATPGQALQAHLDDVANPHAVTAAQTGAATTGALAAVAGDLATHEGDTGNPHAVTAAQAGAAPVAHVTDYANPHQVTAAQVGASVLTAGTQCVQNPYATSTDTSTAHGLAAVPHFTNAALVCLTAEFGYSIGDEIQLPHSPSSGGGMGGGDIGLSYGCNATNCWVSTSAGRVAITHKTTGAVEQITAARWKIVITPYKLA